MTLSCWSVKWPRHTDVEPDATTTASSHCHWTVLQNSTTGGIVITLSGQYADSFEKVGDIWRFTDRLITVDLTGDRLSPLV